MVNSTLKKNKKEYEHSPTLNTVIMVENTLENMNESLITTAQLKKILPKQINHNTLKIILEYLERSNKIDVSIKGITWINNSNKNLKKEISEGLEL